MVNLNCDPVPGQATELCRRSPNSDASWPALPKTVPSSSAKGLQTMTRTTDRWIWKAGGVSGHAEERVTFSKRYSFRSHALFNSDEFDPSELL
jgi:hypothetical protein